MQSESRVFYKAHGWDTQNYTLFEVTVCHETRAGNAIMRWRCGLQAHVGVHAHLGVVVQGDQGPVSDGTADVASLHWVLTHDQVLHGGGVEQLHVGGLYGTVDVRWIS